MDDVVGERVAALCGELSRWPELATMIRDAGALPQLSELLALLANRAAPDERHVAALIDVIEDACARQGLPALTRRVPSLPPGMGADTGGLPGGPARWAGAAGWSFRTRPRTRRPVRRPWARTDG